MVLLEAGCGVGNTIFPLLRNPLLKNLFVYGFDISETAVKLTRENELYDQNRYFKYFFESIIFFF